MTSEADSRKRADAEVVAWKFKYEKAEQAKRYAQTHQKTVEVPVEKKVPYEKCDNCDRTAYQKAKEKCDNRKIQLEKKYKNMTAGYESLMFLLISDNQDRLSGGKNQPEILLGYHQYCGSYYKHSHCNLFWKTD